VDSPTRGPGIRMRLGNIVTGHSELGATPQNLWGINHATWFLCMGLGSALFLNRLLFGIDVEQVLGLPLADVLGLILVGFGGVTAEILKDVVLVTPDLSEAQVATRLLGLKQAKLLKGYRGSPELDVPALAKLVVEMGRIMAGNPAIREIDLNPVIIHPKGEGVVALDALMLVEH